MHLLLESETYEKRMAKKHEIILYRMVLPDHVCPFGLLAKRMLEDSGLPFEERLLTSREEVDAFKAEHGVATTPQVFIDGERIGGSEDLAGYLKKIEAEAAVEA
jgi:glutaredoxin